MSKKRLCPGNNTMHAANKAATMSSTRDGGPKPFFAMVVFKLHVY